MSWKKAKFCGIFRDEFTEKTADFARIWWKNLGHLSGTVCFRRVSPREDNDETVIRVQCTLIVTFPLKLSGQWVKYAFGCVYIDLPISEMKKKSENV